jgi:hypothetical protein
MDDLIELLKSGKVLPESTVGSGNAGKWIGNVSALGTLCIKNGNIDCRSRHGV